MKVQYIAYDGTIFNDKTDCQAYETRNLMGDFSGNRTSDFEDAACFVYIPNKETLEFFRENYGEFPDAKNITDLGFYVWDSIEYGYIKIDLTTFDSLRYFLREYCN